MRLGIKEIEQILPHRHPFLLVDYIEEMEPGVSAVGYKCVTFHEDFFRGHFPQEPVMPGVLTGIIIRRGLRNGSQLSRFLELC